MSRREKSNRTRGGGIGTPDGYLYELTGGEFCLDFANTVDSRPTDAARELLADYGDLVRWSLQAKAITPRVAKRLRARAIQHKRQATAVLRRARALREAIFETFSALTRGVSPPTATLDVLNEHLSNALVRRRLTHNDCTYRWEWDTEDALDRVLWPVVQSAAELLTSDRLDRVRECGADNCAWLFLDQSKNRSRRWCDMAVCGNRVKASRFRQGQRAS